MICLRVAPSPSPSPVGPGQTHEYAGFYLIDEWRLHDVRLLKLALRLSVVDFAKNRRNGNDSFLENSSVLDTPPPWGRGLGRGLREAEILHKNASLLTENEPCFLQADRHNHF